MRNEIDRQASAFQVLNKCFNHCHVALRFHVLRHLQPLGTFSVDTQMRIQATGLICVEHHVFSQEWNTDDVFFTQLTDLLT